MVTDPVRMYSTTWCGHCRRLKRSLQAAGIPFVEIDVDADEHRHYGELIMTVTGGYRTVPTVEVGGKLLVNPSVDEVRAALVAPS